MCYYSRSQNDCNHMSFLFLAWPVIVSRNLWPVLLVFNLCIFNKILMRQKEMKCICPIHNCVVLCVNISFHAVLPRVHKRAGQKNNLVLTKPIVCICCVCINLSLSPYAQQYDNRLGLETPLPLKLLICLDHFFFHFFFIIVFLLLLWGKTQF